MVFRKRLAIFVFVYNMASSDEAEEQLGMMEIEIDNTMEYIESMKNINTKCKTVSDMKVLLRWLEVFNDNMKDKIVNMFSGAQVTGYI